MVLSHTHIHTHTDCQDGFRDCFLWSLYGFTFIPLRLIMQACNILTSPYLINNEWWLLHTRKHTIASTYPPGTKNNPEQYDPLTHVWINSAACQIHTVALWPGTTHSDNWLSSNLRTLSAVEHSKNLHYYRKWHMNGNEKENKHIS